jgi:hypothetical protein
MIIEAVRARKAEAAENIMQEHVVRTIERLKVAAEVAAPGTTRTGDQTKSKGDTANLEPNPVEKPDH